MSNVFVISDTHFFHHKVIQFEHEARPFDTVEEMNEKIIDNWNRVVTKRDKVIHLGDVLFGGVKNIDILDRLKGNKVLVMGNHDEKINAGLWLTKFDDLHGALKYDNCILTHVPVHPDQFYRFDANVHGHLHSKVVTESVVVTTGFGDIVESQPDERYINVSCEQINMTPIEWSTIRKRINDSRTR